MLPFFELRGPPFPAYISERECPFDGADTYESYGAVAVFDTDTGDPAMLLADGSLHVTGIATLTPYQLRMLVGLLPTPEPCSLLDVARPTDIQLELRGHLRESLELANLHPRYAAQARTYGLIQKALRDIPGEGKAIAFWRDAGEWPPTQLDPCRGHSPDHGSGGLASYCPGICADHHPLESE